MSFSTHTARRPTRTRPLSVEALEDRFTPALLLQYGGPGTALSLAEVGAGNDTVTVSEKITPVGNRLVISLGSGTFASGSSRAEGLVYQTGTPNTSTFAVIDHNNANNISDLNIDTGGGNDILSLGFANAAGGIGNVSITGSGRTLETTLDSLSLPGGNLSVAGGRIAVNSGATVATNGGNITLNSTGIGVGFVLNRATVDAGTGHVSITGQGGAFFLSGNDGVQVIDGAKVIGASTTVIGIGGTRGVVNFGVLIDSGATITSRSGAVQVTGTGGVGVASDGIHVRAGGIITSAGAVTLHGTGGDNDSAGLRVFRDGRITASGGDSNLSLGLSASSTIIVDLTADRGTASGYQFIEVETSIDLGGATLQTNGTGSLADSYRLLTNRTFGSNGRFAQTTIVAGGNGFRLNESAGTGNDIDLFLANELRLTYGGAGTALTLTDVVGIDNDVTVTEVRPNVLRLNSGARATFDPASAVRAGLTYENPGSPATSHYVDVAIGAANAVSTLVINLGAGSNTLSLGLANAAGGVRNLTVAGAANAVTSINLETISLPGGNLTVSGGPITVNPGSQIASRGGNITLTGLGTTTKLSGIDIGQATVNGGGGVVTLTGKGGPALPDDRNPSMTPGGMAYGVFLHDGAIILGRTTIVTGTGGDNFSLFGGRQNFGVFVTRNSVITSSGGAVQVTGRGGAGIQNTDHIGVYLLDGGVVTAGGIGSVTVTGTGGSGTEAEQNIGVYVQGAGSQITSAGGAVTVIGQGGLFTSRGSSAIGVAISFGGEVTAGRTGAVTVRGTGGRVGDVANAGVAVVGTRARITSGGGAVRVVGVAGGSGAGNLNFGVVVQLSAVVTAGGLGSVTVIGVGGNTSGGQNHGVYVTREGAAILSSAGPLRVIGQGGGTGPDNDGLRVEMQGSVRSVGRSRLFLAGTGTATRGSAGVRVTGGSRITASGGNAALALGLSPSATLIINLRANLGATSNYQFFHVDGGLDLNRATLRGTMTGPIARGTRFTLLNNDLLDPVFRRLAGGATLRIGNITFTVAYQAGDGNDVQLTRMR